MSSSNWFYAYHLTELFFALAILFLLIVIFYRCWSHCLEIEREAVPLAGGGRSRFIIHYLVSPCRGSQDNEENVPLTHAEYADEDGMRGRLVDAYSRSPGMPKHLSSPLLSGKDDGADEPLLGRPVKGTNMRVQDYSLDMPSNEQLENGRR